jgi:hypothetical protein
MTHGGARPGAGRPPKPPEDRLHSVATHLTEGEIAEARNRAGEAKVKLSQWIRSIVRQVLGRIH